jgi:transposase-like protein
MGMIKMALNISIKEYVTFRKEGYSVSEIAKKFNLQEKQLKSWVYNHRAKIDKALEGVTIPDSKEQKVLRSKEVSPHLEKATGGDAGQLQKAPSSLGLTQKTLTFEEIKDKLRRQKNDYEMLQSNYEKLLEAHSKLKEEFTDRGIALNHAENKAADLDAQYKQNFETAKQEWETQYTEMRDKKQTTIDKLLDEAKLKDSQIQELTTEAEQLAKSDDEIQDLKDQLMMAQAALQRAFDESERYRTMYEKEVVPLRQLALIKLEADCSAQMQ